MPHGSSKRGLVVELSPTKRAKEPIGSSFSLPQGTIQGSAFYDEEGEAVREKAREEAREDAELAGMMAWDKQQSAVEAPRAVTFAEAVAVEAEMSEEEPEVTVLDGPPKPVVASDTAPVVFALSSFRCSWKCAANDSKDESNNPFTR